VGLQAWCHFPLKSDLDFLDGDVRDGAGAVGGGSEPTGTTPAPQGVVMGILAIVCDMLDLLNPQYGFNATTVANHDVSNQRGELEWLQ